MEVELILLYCFSNKVIVLTSFTVTKGLETSEVFGGIVIWTS